MSLSLQIDRGNVTVMIQLSVQLSTQSQGKSKGRDLRMISESQSLSLEVRLSSADRGQ